MRQRSSAIHRSVSAARAGTTLLGLLVLGLAATACEPYRASCYPSVDADGDGYRVPQLDRLIETSFVYCMGEWFSGVDEWKSDCDDTDPAVHRGAPEHCFDGIDNNCIQGIDREDPECARYLSTPRQRIAP